MNPQVSALSTVVSWVLAGAPALAHARRAPPRSQERSDERDDQSGTDDEDEGQDQQHAYGSAPSRTVVLEPRRQVPPLVHLAGGSTPVRDVRAEELRPLAASVPHVLAALDPALADDRELVAAVVDCTAGLRRG